MDQAGLEGAFDLVFESRVILILENDFEEKILAPEMSGDIWIVGSERNLPCVEKARGLDPLRVITTFFLRDGETPGSACNRIIISLDEHHSEQSPGAGYKALEVIGVSLPDVDRSIFLDLGFSGFVETKSGFLAMKGALGNELRNR
uniref:hypothetical protein n=1 Tax=Castellaniella defragrans TaxID=75697 RepID=UPI00333EE61A